MSAELLAAIAGILLSVGFEYIPGLRERYNALDDTRQRLVMLVLLVLAAVGAFALSCTGWWSFVSCNQAGAVGLINTLIVAITTNQTTFLILPKRKETTQPPMESGGQAVL